jgi:phage shock protein PspC (stress-responsive transcriptional regulator)
MKKLYRSRTDRKLCGVCGGFAEYFEIDATILRILLIIFVLCGGAGILAYIVAALLMQTNPNQ